MDINPLSDVSLVNMFSYSVSCLFILLMVSFAVQNCFSLIYSNLFFFLFFFLPKEIYQKKILLREMFETLLLMFSSRKFMVLNLTFKSLIHFEFILVHGVRRWSSFFFFPHLSNIPNTIYWIDYLYPIVCSCLICQILIYHKGVGLFLGSLFQSIDLYVCFYASTMLFCLLQPYCIFDIR